MDFVLLLFVVLSASFDCVLVRRLQSWLMRDGHHWHGVVMVFVPYPRCIVQRSLSVHDVPIVQAHVAAFAFGLPLGCNDIRMSDVMS